MSAAFLGVIKVLATVMGIVMSLSYYPQAYTMWKHKSAQNVSLLTFSIFAFGTLVWFIYGLSIHDFQLIVGFMFGVIGSFLVLFLTLYYRKKG